MAPFENIEIELSVLVGETTMPLEQVLNLVRGAVIPLGRDANGPLTILANNIAVAQARVELDGDRVCVAVTTGVVAA